MLEEDVMLHTRARLGNCETGKLGRLEAGFKSVARQGKNAHAASMVKHMQGAIDWCDDDQNGDPQMPQAVEILDVG
jgi:hypothetical protein